MIAEAVPRRRKSDLDVPLISILGGTELFREGLARVLQKEGFPDVQAYADVDTLQRADGQQQVVIVESSTGNSGLAICSRLREEMLGLRIVLLAADYDLEELTAAFAAGVDGYLVVTMSCDQLAGALRLIGLGVKVPPARLVEALSGPAMPASAQIEASASDVLLSTRELEIVRCLVEGLPNKLISRRLHISDATVKVHVKAVLRKLKLFNRTQVATWAIRSGLAPAAGAQSVGASIDGAEPIDDWLDGTGSA